MSLKLIVLQSMPQVQALLDRLHEAGIAACSATERNVGELHLGGNPSIGVWIDDREDAGRAMGIVREMFGGAGLTACPECGYDLRGHTGSTRCPECGFPVYRPDQRESAPARGEAEVTCPACGQPVPDNFEICWSCGADVPAPERDA